MFSSFFYFQLTDFGLSVVKGGQGHDNMMQDFCGTPMYMGMCMCMRACMRVCLYESVYKCVVLWKILGV